MADLKNVVYISNADYETLITNGSVTVNGTTVTYDPNDLYITPEEDLNIISATGTHKSYNGSSPVSVSIEDLCGIATTLTAGLVKSSNTGTTADRNYNVQVNSDGTMKVNVPWTNTTYSAATQSAAGLMSIDDKKKLDGIAVNATKVTSDTVSGWGYTKNTGTVTSVATSGTGISGGTITSTGTITLDSSSAGNAAANKVIIRNAAGSIQTEKLAVSSGTTTKATMQYNSTDDCIEFIFA